jgi:hypothetical protein
MTESVRRAQDYLMAHLISEGELASYLHTQWIAGGLLYGLGEGSLGDALLLHVCRRIDHDTPASNLSWLATSVLACGVPCSHQVVQKALLLLEAAQEPDGRWRSEDGSQRDAWATLEALYAFKLAGRWRPFSPPMGPSVPRRQLESV